MKNVNIGTIITDNETSTKWSIADITCDGFDIDQITAIGKGGKEKISFSDFLDKYDHNKISVSDFDRTEPDSNLLHTEIARIVANKRADKREDEILSLTEEESEFKNGGVIGKIKYNKKGQVTEIKNQYGKVLSEVKVGDTIYKKDGKHYKSESNNILSKEDSEKIEVVKRGEKREINTDNKVKETAKIIARKGVGSDQTILIQELFQKNIIDIDDVQNLFKDEFSPKENLTWYNIKGAWLIDKLLEENETIIDNNYGAWWGRETTEDPAESSAIINIAKGISKHGGMYKEGGKTFSGYTNQETFIVSSYIDNNKSSNDYWNERAKKIWHTSTKTNYGSRHQMATIDLSHELKEYFLENNPLTGESNVYIDLLSSALGKVEWNDISSELLRSNIGSKEKKEGGAIEGTTDTKNKVASGRYIELKEVPNGLEMTLTDEGEKFAKERLSEKYADAGEIVIFDMFKDIKSNSEYIFHVDLGGSGFGLTSAPGITKEYHIGDWYNKYETNSPETAKVYWYPEYEGNDLLIELLHEGSVILPESKSFETGGKVDITPNYYRFRQKSPKGVSQCAVPGWATRVAESVKKGSKITTCKKDGKWFLQSIMIPKDGVNSGEAKSLANEIKSIFSKNKKAYGGYAEQDNADIHFSDTISGLEEMIELSDGEEREKYIIEMRKLNPDYDVSKKEDKKFFSSFDYESTDWGKAHMEKEGFKKVDTIKGENDEDVTYAYEYENK